MLRQPLTEIAARTPISVIQDGTWALDKELYVIAPGEPGYKASKREE